MHLVHRNLKYRDMSEALNHEDGVAVLGCLFKLSNVGNGLLSRIFDSTSKIIEPGTITYVIYSFAMLDLLPPLHSYFTYKGSLTTPACNESVTWIIFNTVTNIHQHEVRNIFCACSCWISNDIILYFGRTNADQINWGTGGLLYQNVRGRRTDCCPGFPAPYHLHFWNLARL